MTYYLWGVKRAPLFRPSRSPIVGFSSVNPVYLIILRFWNFEKLEIPFINYGIRFMLGLGVSIGVPLGFFYSSFVIFLGTYGLVSIWLWTFYIVPRDRTG